MIWLWCCLHVYYLTIIMGEMISFQHFLVNNGVAVLAGYDPWRTGGVKRLVL